MQKTFGEIVGMNPIVPSAELPDDFIVSEDGKGMLRKDGFVDCAGKVWSNDDLRKESNVRIVEELLNTAYMFEEIYCTSNSDYANHFWCILDDPYMIAENFADYFDGFEFDKFVEYHFGVGRSVNKDKVFRRFYDEITDFAEPVYDPSDYSGYSGEGVCIGSFGIGEVETCLDFCNFPALARLHESDELDDVLDEVNSDAYVWRSKARVRNEKSGGYDYVGRQTYKRQPGITHLDISCHINGQWHFVVSEVCIKDLLLNIIEYYIE